MNSAAPFSITVKPSIESSKRHVAMEISLRFLDFGVDQQPKKLSQYVALQDLGFYHSGSWRFWVCPPQHKNNDMTMSLKLEVNATEPRAAVVGSFQVFKPKTGTWSVIEPFRTVLKYDRMNGQDGFGIIKYDALSHDEMANNNSDYVKDGVLLVKVDFEFSLELPNRNGILKTLPAPCTSAHCVRRAELFRTKSSTDFVLISNDGREFPVHRFMLASQSNVFAAMLKPGMVEASSGRCGIKDVDGDTLDILVEFLYTSCPGRVAKDAEKVLKAADKYEVMEKAVTALIMAQGDPVVCARVWKEVAELSSEKK